MAKKAPNAYQLKLLGEMSETRKLFPGSRVRSAYILEELGLAVSEMACDSFKKSGTGTSASFSRAYKRTAAGTEYLKSQTESQDGK